MVLGQKRATVDRVYAWKREHNYHLPRLLNLKDTVYYVTRADTVADDIARTLEGYPIRSCLLTPASLTDATAVLEAERAKRPPELRGESPGAMDAVKALVDGAKRGMGGNTVILVEAAGLDAGEARIVQGLLEKGVPFIVIERPEVKVPEELDLPVMVRQMVGGADAVKKLAELRDYIDAQQAHGMAVITRTLFFEKSVRLFWFQFGKTDRDNRDISRQVLKRMVPSLLITVPAFILGIFLDIFIAMIVAFTRGTYVDRSMAVVCIVIMSVLSLFYYFSAQMVFGTWLRIFPVSGFLPGWSAARFVLLPVAVSLFMGIGGGVRFYRTIFLEEINRDYVRTARSKGLSEVIILYKHVLKNAMIPILTNSVLAIPMLFMGALILEQFFGIPGLGNFTLDGIQSQDFRIVGSMVYLGSCLYIAGLILTDISYTLVDPRVRFE
ncbi:MAG: ABC transporter permease [Planctomycetota bacterium]